MPKLIRNLAGCGNVSPRFYLKLAGQATACTIVIFLSASLFAQGAPEIHALVQRAHAALEAGDFAAAVRLFEHAHNVAPDNVEVSRGLLESYLRPGDLISAIPIGKEAAERLRKMRRFIIGLD
jgi:thioredoxin-like negative regulator of GroEL